MDVSRLVLFDHASVEWFKKLDKRDFVYDVHSKHIAARLDRPRSTDTVAWRAAKSCIGIGHPNARVARSRVSAQLATIDGSTDRPMGARRRTGGSSGAPGRRAGDFPATWRD